MDLVKCRAKDVIICPANHALYSTESDSCAMSLFQSPRTQETCRRSVTSRLPRPGLEIYGSTVLYSLAEPQIVYLQCQSNRTSEVRSLLIEGGAFLLNAGRCSLITEGFQLLLVLKGRSSTPHESQNSSPLLFKE
jgi:hypothetical protein